MCLFQRYSPASGPRSRGARVLPRPNQGSPALAADEWGLWLGARDPEFRQHHWKRHRALESSADARRAQLVPRRRRRRHRGQEGDHRHVDRRFGLHRGDHDRRADPLGSPPASIDPVRAALHHGGVSELPSGTVTFVFTDVEGSTRLLQELGAGYADALSGHRRIVREAFRRHGGVEVDTQGDAFFFAFARASDALAAALDAREGLEQSPIRVRMGLHTGEPIVTNEGYVGIDVHRAARIAAAGHGGQIVLSQATRELAGADGLRDLGEHRLKDLSAPERLYQLGEGEFPPLKTLYQTNLPVQPTPLVGRERELGEVIELLRRERLGTP